jgi:hypothetical protein
MDGLTEAGRWEVLDRHSNKPPIPARSEFTRVSLSEASTELYFDPDWEPERHVNILGWEKLDDAALVSSTQSLYRSQLCIVR